MTKRLIAIFAFLASFFAVTAFAQTAVPLPINRFTDLAHTVAPYERARIETELAEYLDATGAKFAILTVPSLVDEDVSAFSERVFEAWKLDSNGPDAGVLMVVVNDRLEQGMPGMVNIRVGKGLTGSLPSAVTNKIVAEKVVPLLRKKRFSEAYSAGIGEVRKAVSAGIPKLASEPPAKSFGVSGKTVELIFLAILVFLVSSALSPIIGALAAAASVFSLVYVGFDSSLAAAFGISIIPGAYLIAKIIRSALMQEPSGIGEYFRFFNSPFSFPEPDSSRRGGNSRHGRGG